MKASVSLSGSSGLESSSASGRGPTDQPLSGCLPSHQPVEGHLCLSNPPFVIWMWQIPSERMQGCVGTYRGPLWSLEACLLPPCCHCSFSVVWRPHSLILVLTFCPPGWASGQWTLVGLGLPESQTKEGGHTQSRPDREVLYLMPSTEDTSEGGSPQPCSWPPLSTRPFSPEKRAMLCYPNGACCLHVTLSSHLYLPLVAEAE